MNTKTIEKKASKLKRELGGTIFAFPIEEDNPYSKYAISIYTGGGFSTYPEPLTIEEAAASIKSTLEAYKKTGLKADYDKHVRFVSYEPQVNSPSVTMRRLRKAEASQRIFEPEKDVIPNGEDFNFTARGVIKISYISMVDDKLPKPKKIMMEYYKLLASRRYGKTANSIHKEVSKMSKFEAINWIERTYEQYVRRDDEILNIMEMIKK